MARTSSGWGGELGQLGLEPGGPEDAKGVVLHRGGGGGAQNPLPDVLHGPGVTVKLPLGVPGQGIDGQVPGEEVLLQVPAPGEGILGPVQEEDREGLSRPPGSGKTRLEFLFGGVQDEVVAVGDVASHEMVAHRTAHKQDIHAETHTPRSAWGPGDEREKTMNEILLYESGDLDVGELTPETLSDAHPLWEKGVEFLGPWERVPGEDAARWGLEGARLWRAREEGPLPRLLIIRTCGSTMDFVRGLAETGRWPAWGAVLSVEQPLGVGRMGSRWCSGPGNLHVSWLWPRAEGEEDLDGLVPLAAGHGAALGLERLGLKDVRVKWPNDLLWREGKAGGILVQDRQGATVAGLGLNLAFSPGEEEMEEREEGAPRPVSFHRDMPPP